MKKGVGWRKEYCSANRKWSLTAMLLLLCVSMCRTPVFMCLCVYVSMCLCVAHLDSDTALVANQPQKPSRHFFHCAVCVRKREGVSVCVCVCVCARGRGTNKPSQSRCPHKPRAVTVYNQEISNNKNRQDNTQCLTAGQVT